MIFSVDLVSSARALIAFLRRVHGADENAHGQLYRESPEFSRAVEGYRIWMGRAAQVGATEHPPPSLEVAWIWFLHRLDPHDYATDCHAFAGHLIDCDAGHPFAYTDGAPCATGASEGSAMGTISVDLAACAERQGGFLWQVRWAEYEREDFLCDALARYGKLVGLWATTEDTFLVPTYDIDLMWHAHMANPAAYAADCMRLIGRLIGHDDSDTDRDEGSKLCNGANLTAELWEARYPGTTWHTPGAMWRGEPPRWYYEEPLLAVNVGEALSPSWSWWRSTSISPPPSPAANVEIEFDPDAALAARRARRASARTARPPPVERSVSGSVGRLANKVHVANKRAVGGIVHSPTRLARQISNQKRQEARQAECKDLCDRWKMGLCAWACLALATCILSSPYIAAMIGYFKAADVASQLSNVPQLETAPRDWTTATERCVDSAFVVGVVYPAMLGGVLVAVLVAVLVGVTIATTKKEKDEAFESIMAIGVAFMCLVFGAAGLGACSIATWQV